MKHNILAGLFAVPLLVVALAQTSHADDATTTTTPCKDGTSSTSTGRGTCSGHGGVQMAGAPAGATAKCKDGTYSKSQHRSGTCSSHGGVDTWLTAQ